MGNRDRSNVDCRLEIDECRLPLIIDRKAFERRQLFHDYNRPCM